jgi:hypothetical protein
LAADSLAQSVADIARRERDRQRTVQSKVAITSSESTTVASSTPAGAASAATAPAATSKPGLPQPGQARDENYWRSAFQRARDDAKRAEARAAVLDLRIKQLNTDMLQYSSFYNREYRLGPELTAAQKELEDARREAEQARKKINDLEEELRRSGGPAGWAR